MSNDSRIRDLTEKYVDGALSEQEMVELLRLIVGHADAADAFYAAAQQDGRLVTHFRRQRGSVSAEQNVQVVTAGSNGAQRGRKESHRKTWQACATAYLFTAV